MKIREVKSTYGTDFYATYICEHCDHITDKLPGYDDANFHENVIPKRHCQKCEKRRDGTLKKENTNA